MKFKKILLSVFCMTSLLFEAEKSIIIGATPTPYTEILNFAKPTLREGGWDLEIKGFSDYNIPNVSLNEKDLDANLYQHKPFLEDFNAHKGTKLNSLGSIVLVPMAIYSNDTKDIRSASDGARIVIPSDATNESRALDLLTKADLIRFKISGTLKTPINIGESPKDLRFIELRATQLPGILNDVGLATTTTSYALGVGLDPLRNGIFTEDKDNLYAIALAVRQGDEKNEKSLILKEILTSDKIKNFISK